MAEQTENQAIVAVELTADELLILDTALRFVQFDHVRRQGHGMTEKEFGMASGSAFVKVDRGLSALFRLREKIGE